MSHWRNCRASGVLLNEVNARWPRRDKRSDGTLGDASHTARPSDHNPNRYRVVTARDIDKDGILAGTLAEHIRVLGSRNFAPLRGGYVIFNRRIAGTHTRWAWKAYTGSNPHTNHIHVSFADAPSNYDNTSSWGIRSIGAKPAPAPSGHSHPMPLLKAGMNGNAVTDLQRHLNRWRRARGMAAMPVDGDYGRTTKYCVEVFQQAYRLTRDGIVGPTTWRYVHNATNGAY